MSNIIASPQKPPSVLNLMFVRMQKRLGSMGAGGMLSRSSSKRHIRDVGNSELQRLFATDADRPLPNTPTVYPRKCTRGSVLATVTVPLNVFNDGRFPTFTVPLTGCTEGKFVTSTC